MARFIYYNVEPLGKRKIDCVVRAIKLATGLPYGKVEEKIYYTGELLDCDSLNKNCYGFLLSKVFDFPKVPCKGLTVAEFADLHPDGVYIVRVPSHLTCVRYGDCYDIWDCRFEPCDIAWAV